MAEILYIYKDNVYVNLTNRCNGRCTFCVRNKMAGVDGHDLVLEKDSTYEELIKAIDGFDFTGFSELVYCGYGEPTCALDNLIATAKYAKEKLGIKIRVNTNGMGNLYNKRNIVPELNSVVDGYSVSLNAHNATRYDELVRPPYANAFYSVLDFAIETKKAGKDVAFSVVSVISSEEIEECRKLANSLGIPLKVRQYS